MPTSLNYKLFKTAAIRDGRKCKRCGWLVKKEDWKTSEPFCADCADALKGVNVSSPFGKFKDEPDDMTGES